MRDIFTDPEFAGLHWSIPPDTPEEDREMAHLAAAHAAKAARDRDLNRPVRIFTDHGNNLLLLMWPNGSLTWMTPVEIAAARISVKERT